MITKNKFLVLAILFFVFVSLSFVSPDHGKVHSVNEGSADESLDKESPKKSDGLKDFSSTKKKDYSNDFAGVEVFGRGLTSVVSSNYDPLDVSLSNADNGKYFDIGDEGQDVNEIQEFLLDQGYKLPKYGADSIYGSETKSAVRDWQADAGLEGVDGLFGPESLNAAKKASRSSLSNRFIFNYDKSYLKVGDVFFENMSGLGRSYVTLNPLGKVVRANFTVSSEKGGNYSIRGVKFYVRSSPDISRVLYTKKDGLTLPASANIIDAGSSALDRGFDFSSESAHGKFKPVFLSGGGVLFGEATITNRGILVKEGSFTTSEGRPVSTKGGSVLIANENASLSGYNGNWVKSSSKELEIKSSAKGRVSVDVRPGKLDYLGRKGEGHATFTSNNGDKLVVESREHDVPLVKRGPSSSGHSTIETGSKEIRIDDDGVYAGDNGENDFSNLGLDIEANSSSMNEREEWTLDEGSLTPDSEEDPIVSHGDEGDGTKKILVLAESPKNKLGKHFDNTDLRQGIKDPKLKSLGKRYLDNKAKLRNAKLRQNKEVINRLVSRQKQLSSKYRKRLNEIGRPDRSQTFIKEAKNVKQMYADDPNTKVQVIPYYGKKEFKKVRKKVSSLDDEDKVLIFGHSGERLGGIRNQKIANSIENSPVNECYIGSCDFSEYVGAYEGIDNVYYRGQGKWLGFNYGADNLKDGMFSRTNEGTISNNVKRGDEYSVTGGYDFKEYNLFSSKRGNDVRYSDKSGWEVRGPEGDWLTADKAGYDPEDLEKYLDGRGG